MSGQRWITIGLLLGLALLGFALLSPAVFRSREAARQTQSKDNLKQIGLAVLNYHETEGSLPPGGIIREDDTAMQGWMTMILPYVDDTPYFSWLDLNESWQSPRNTFVFGTALPVFLIPGVNARLTASGFGLTCYQGNPNLLYRNSGVTFSQMKNGTAHTWLAGEVTGNFQPWAYPFNWRPLGTKLCAGPASYGYPEWNGGHLLFADGSVSFFSQETSPEILKRFAAAPPIATAEQIATPDQVFQTGPFQLESIKLESDTESKHNYFGRALKNSEAKLLLIQVFYVEKGASTQKTGGPSPQLLLSVDSSTDIAQALKETSMAEDATSEQLAANVKTLQTLQQKMVPN
ncbi:DUF1559 family PulG-like putative transporter [Gimesia fumaroli]|uniref:DUF1559 domain-containing protein n=1 Tax=Gimesia fumaroli TaxID=2527976 RepID=A0A518I754_9PLAN|nr:DUF1559 domain-containing protein [Gimesia fumaroli]QDV48899.1 hypothetical protein Enr17x_09140 [Gimesia fumaroli]